VNRYNYIAALDIGTSKICTLIAERDEMGELTLKGMGITRSRGLRRGSVVDLQLTVQAIEKSVKEAEMEAEIPVHSVYVGIAGDHIQSINSNGIVPVSGHRNEVTQEDVDRVIGAAKAMVMPMDREIIHVLPQEFMVDNQSGIRHPIGIAGVRLEAKIHVVTGAITFLQNICKCVSEADLKVEELVLQPLASAEAVLNEDEKDLGVVVIDIGGGTTDVLIYYQGSVYHSGVVGLGGDNITRDISFGLRTPLSEAERLKKEYGCAIPELVTRDETIEVPGIGGRRSRTISRQVLSAIVGPRMVEILEHAAREVRKIDYDMLLAAGVVLTGGGSILEGTCELAEKIFKMPARLGYPQGIRCERDILEHPMFSTAMGLLLRGNNGEGSLSRSIWSERSFFEDKIEKVKKKLLAVMNIVFH
jgi:cell division protein FtsA